MNHRGERVVNQYRTEVTESAVKFILRVLEDRTASDAELQTAASLAKLLFDNSLI